MVIVLGKRCARSAEGCPWWSWMHGREVWCSGSWTEEGRDVRSVRMALNKAEPG
jgi:hypothetical protein